MRALLLQLVKAYRYISKFLPKNCRYYPTCSEYALWQLECAPVGKAVLSSTLRILRCNQLFKGGIDYPVVNFDPPKISALKPKPKNIKIVVKYWLVPKNNNSYYLIKDIYGTKYNIK